MTQAVGAEPVGAVKPSGSSQAPHHTEGGRLVEASTAGGDRQGPVLATTRSVRKRLDLTRPVEREVLEECLRLGQQAPTASYAQNWHFVVVTDPQRRAALGELWRAVAGPYVERRAAAAAADEPWPASTMPFGI